MLFFTYKDDADGAPAAFEYILLLGYRVPSMFFRSDLILKS
jgi:hypothetical protein